MKLRLATCLLLLSVVPAVADSREGESDDRGRRFVHRGTWEADLVGLGVLTSDTEDGVSTTRLSTDFAATLAYFVNRSVSVGASLLADYENVGGGVTATTFGASANVVWHAPLGMGAYFRPGISVGALFGSRKTPTGPGMLAEASQAGLITRVQLPIAYFAGKRFLLQAGPQLNFIVGGVTPTGGESKGFTRVAGGFAVGGGYTF